MHVMTTTAIAGCLFWIYLLSCTVRMSMGFRFLVNLIFLYPICYSDEVASACAYYFSRVSCYLPQQQFPAVKLRQQLLKFMHGFTILQQNFLFKMMDSTFFNFINIPNGVYLQLEGPVHCILFSGLICSFRKDILSSTTICCKVVMTLYLVNPKSRQMVITSLVPLGREVFILAF